MLQVDLVLVLQNLGFANPRVLNIQVPLTSIPLQR